MKPKKVLGEEHTLMLTHSLTQSRRGSARIVHISRHKRPILAAGLWSVCVSGHGLSVPQWRGLSGPDLPPVGIRLQLCQWTGRAGNSGVQRCERMNTCCVLEKPFASFTCFIKCLYLTLTCRCHTEDTDVSLFEILTSAESKRERVPEEVCERGEEMWGTGENLWWVCHSSFPMILQSFFLFTHYFSRSSCYCAWVVSTHYYKENSVCLWKTFV